MERKSSTGLTSPARPARSLALQVHPGGRTLGGSVSGPPTFTGADPSVRAPLFTPASAGPAVQENQLYGERQMTSSDPPQQLFSGVRGGTAGTHGDLCFLFSRVGRLPQIPPARQAGGFKCPPAQGTMAPPLPCQPPAWAGVPAGPGLRRHLAIRGREADQKVDGNGENEKASSANERSEVISLLFPSL